MRKMWWVQKIRLTAPPSIAVVELLDVGEGREREIPALGLSNLTFAGTTTRLAAGRL